MVRIDSLMCCFYYELIVLLQLQRIDVLFGNYRLLFHYLLLSIYHLWIFFIKLSFDVPFIKFVFVVPFIKFALFVPS
jgi:hypothetical protein